MNLFSYVKSQLSILDVISEYTKLKKAGTYWKANCPIHHEKTASFTVSPHKEIFYCFGCHAGGDLISFIAQMENCTQLEATQQLIERYNIEIPDSVSKQVRQDPNKKNKYFYICKTIASWANEMLRKSPLIINYLKKRGFNEKSIDLFNIGYFPGGLKSIKMFVSKMQSESILLTDLLEIKVIFEGKNIIYSPFEDRIIFPIKNHLGHNCGFGGRIFKPHDKRAKYYNSHENNFFSKRSLLFGFDLAKKSVQKKESLFLVEGYTDCIAMVQHGLNNTAATLGTACTSEHLKNLSRHINQLFILYDNDKAGNKAIIRLTELCWQVNIELKVVILPEGEDPSSFLNNGGNINLLIDQSIDIFTFFINSIALNFSKNPLNKKLKQIEKLLVVINKIEEPLKQDIILQKASESLNIPLESLRSELEKLYSTKKFKKKELKINNETKSKTIKNTPIDSKLSLEKRILFAILNNVSLFNNNNEDYLITCLPIPLSSILKKLKTVKEQQRTLTPDFSHLFKILNEHERLFLSRAIFQYDEKIGNQSFNHLMQRFKNKTWKVIVRDMKSRLADAELKNNTKEVENILQDFSKLKKTLLQKNLVFKNNE